MLKLITVLETQRALVFHYGRFMEVLGPGRHLRLANALRVDLASLRDLTLSHPDLLQIARSGKLAKLAEVVEVADLERALVTVDGRYAGVLLPGVNVVWTVGRKVAIEKVDARDVLFRHDNLAAIMNVPGIMGYLELVQVEQEHRGLLYIGGEFRQLLGPGRHALWKGVSTARVVPCDLRERIVEIAGQDLMTADRVSVRLNLTVVVRVVDALKAASVATEPTQVLYREAQLVLRNAVGARDLDALLNDRMEVTAEVLAKLQEKAGAYGHAVVSAGVRDIILPGEMRELLNKVTEARKAAEASLITRREETAAMRSQLNTARLLEENPVLVRMRELEALERIASKTKLTVLTGEGGLADRVVKLL